MRDRIELHRGQLPYRVSIPLASEVFGLEFHFNARDNRYTVNLSRGETTLCAGEPLVYGRALFANVYEAGVYPVLRLVPLDETGNSSDVTKENMGVRVFLTVEDER